MKARNFDQLYILYTYNINIITLPVVHSNMSTKEVGIPQSTYNYKKYNTSITP